MEYDDTFHTSVIVTSLYEVFIEWMEYDDTFHISSHCDLTVWSIYWVNGVWWHLSYLFSLWPHCMKYLLSEWSMMTPFIPLLIVTSLYEVFIEWMEYDDTFHTSVIVTSLYEVFIEWMEYDDTFHISSNCDLTVWSIYWVNGVWWHLSYLFSLWPHCMKYLLSEWSMMTPFIPLLIVTSLYEVFIEWMEYDDTFHTSVIVTSLYEVFIEWMEYDDTFHISSNCDLTVWSIYWVNDTFHCMNYLLSEWSMMTPFISLLIVTSLYEVFIEWMEYEDTFHISSHCDLTLWSIYWVNGVWWHLPYLCTLWPHWLK